MENFSKRIESWDREILEPGLERYPERKDHFYLDSGIEIKRIYLPEKDGDYFSRIGMPGDYPFTRGIHPTMYRGKLWTIRQYAGFGTAAESNRRYRYLLKEGTTGLSVAFDLPTQMGYDSDHPLSEGEVGRVGVAIDSLRDMEILFDGIPLEKVSTSMTINSTAPILLSMYIALAENRGIDLTLLSGTVQNDVLKEYIARGTYIFPPRESLRIATDIFQYCSEHMPRWNSISISGYHIREAGSDAVQELSFTFANAIEYLNHAKEKGLNLENFGSRLSFFFNSHTNFFEEVAKFRAARRIWAGIMSEKFGVRNRECMKLRFHTQTGGSTLISKNVGTNVVRVALQALAAVLGGTQSLHTNAADEALALPSESSVKLALRTQQVIAHESGVADTVDPLGGSYFVESLTDEIEGRVWEYLEKIESIGGAVEAVKSGYFQSEIERTSYKIQREIETGERIVVGLNQFVDEEVEKVDLLVVDPLVQKRQIEHLKNLRMERNNSRVKKVLRELRGAAESGENLIPPIIRCVKAYTTLGEISDCLRGVFGEYKR